MRMLLESRADWRSKNTIHDRPFGSSGWSWQAVFSFQRAEKPHSSSEPWIFWQKCVKWYNSHCYINYIDYVYFVFELHIRTTVPNKRIVVTGRTAHRPLFQVYYNQSKLDCHTTDYAKTCVYSIAPNNFVPRVRPAEIAGTMIARRWYIGTILQQ